ncbi:CAMK protein kinase [Phytophthora nicotianae INRA-310]|uniref:CAMK protein kinase n=1 Tax=Phytophthora nicotianae (strain INRA-310) TaxID=761204 RepID=W2QBN3_PHYN3|nr:CAMK protein kinase [Phytophthora nicotianae INRA-310]ETN10567.1 CAMK protein kinase [Phytophthora nicotianae INRA-310]
MPMMPAPSLSIQVHPSLQTVYVRMKDRSGTVAIDMTPSLLSPKELIVRFHEQAFGKSFAAFAANSSLLARRRNEETLVTSLNDLQDGEVLVYKPCEELRTLVEQGCITPVLATHSPVVDVSPSSSPLGLKRKGRAKSVTNNVERVHRYASDLAKMDVSPKERELIEDMLIVGDEQVVDAMEQFVVHRNPALVRRVLHGPAAKKKNAALDNLSMDFSSMDMHSPAVPTSGHDFSDPFLVGGQNPFVRAAADAEPQHPSMMNVDDHTATDGGRPSLLFDDALSSPPIFLQSIKEKVTPPSGQSARMSLSLSNDLDPSRNAQTPTQLFSVEKLLDNVPVARNFHEKYTVGAVLGSGKYSVVKRCTKQSTGEQFAVKIIDKRQMIEVRFLKRELEIMYGLRHDGVVRLTELFESNESLFLVMELCGQELFEFIDRNGPLPESTTRPLIRKLVRTVAYLHAQCIVHRDIKPENILLPPNSQDMSDIKLSDFGIARKLDGHGHDNVLTPHESLSEVANLHDAPATSATGLPSATDMVRNRMARAHTKCGTRDYIAPEVMSGKGYGTEADLWSVGVVTYVLASGCAPVFLPTAEGVKKVFFADETWSGASEDLKRFIEALLVRNPEKRITAADALEHPWLKQ